MNPLNYASLEASKRLVETGIVLETEAFWIKVADRWRLVHSQYYYVQKNSDCIPAPSMAEVWRELPDETEDNGIKYRKVITVGFNVAVVGYYSTQVTVHWLSKFESANPSDALIDLLIWQRKEKP